MLSPTIDGDSETLIVWLGEGAVAAGQSAPNVADGGGDGAGVNDNAAPSLAGVVDHARAAAEKRGVGGRIVL